MLQSRPGSLLKQQSLALLLPLDINKTVNNQYGTWAQLLQLRAVFDIAVTILKIVTIQKIFSYNNLDSHIAESHSIKTVIFWKTL